jgi:hypothetical protein
MKLDKKYTLAFIGLIVLSQYTASAASFLGAEAADDGASAESSETTASDATGGHRSARAQPNMLPRPPGASSVLTSGAENGQTGIAETTTTTSGVSESSGNAQGAARAGSEGTIPANALVVNPDNSFQVGSLDESTLSVEQQGTVTRPVQFARQQDASNIEPLFQDFGVQDSVEIVHGVTPARDGLKIVATGLLVLIVAAPVIAIVALIVSLTTPHVTVRSNRLRRSIPTVAPPPTFNPPHIALYNMGTKKFLRQCIECSNSATNGVSVRADGASLNQSDTQWLPYPVGGSRNITVLQNVATGQFLTQSTSASGTANSSSDMFFAQTTTAVSNVPLQAQFQVSSASAIKSDNQTIGVWTLTNLNSHMQLSASNTTQATCVGGDNTLDPLERWVTVLLTSQTAAN